MKNNSTQKYIKYKNITKNKNQKYTKFPYNVDIKFLNKKRKNKKYKKKNNSKLNLNPNNIKNIKELINNEFNFDININTFIIFKSITDIIFAVYVIDDTSIIFYNLINNQKINEIKNAYNDYIFMLKYYFDKMNKKDLLMSSSNNNNDENINIKIWNINKIECIYNLSIKKIGNEFFPSFFRIKNQIYIIINTGNYIEIYNLNGNLIKEMYHSSHSQLKIILDNYDDYILNDNYIIGGEDFAIYSYDYNMDKLYHIYYEINSDDLQFNLFDINIYNKKDNIFLLGVYRNIIRIFNFHSGKILTKIKVNNNNFCSMCLWSNEFIFVGCENFMRDEDDSIDNSEIKKTIKLIKLNKGKILNNINIIKNDEITSIIKIQKIFHPKYGDCLITLINQNSENKFFILN